tara:strand:+ start:790 stop:1269 length:480 start_codon:yes stop_codon:yes gene_type:complete
MRKKKEPTFAYGIEITKPFSKEMYDHNDMVAKEMRLNIFKQWNALIHGIDLDTDWEDFGDDESVVKLQKLVCYSGYGSGYTLRMVNDEFCNELNNMANWQLHEEYSYGCFERLLPRTKYMMIGFDWCKHDYGTEVLVNPHAKVVNKVVDRLMENSIDNQ